MEREAHQKNIELLNALRKTQAEHTQTLASHTQRLDSIDRTLVRHGERMETIDGKLGQLTVGMHTIESLLRRLADEDRPRPRRSCCCAGPKRDFRGRNGMRNCKIDG